MPRRSIDLLSRPPLDRWLRFSPSVQAYHDRENGAVRLREMRSAILIGLIFYNFYNVTSLVLLPDVLNLAIVLRLAVVTPLSLFLYWLVGRTRHATAEWLLTAGTIGVYLVPVFLFWKTQAPAGLFTFAELPLTIMFATMMLALRFPKAVLFIIAVLAVTFLALATKPGLPESLALAFAMQITTACLFSLFANYRLERRRCSDFLATLMASIIADNAEAARREFQDLSQTDALTQLPNRRTLADRMAQWHEAREAMSVLMVDIDHFKHYNDAYGHLAGDRCLRIVADTLGAVTKLAGEGLCARFGGEEFVIVVRDRDGTKGRELASALIEAVRSLDLPHPGGRSSQGRVTVSVGVASCGRVAGEEPQELIARADGALYAAKSAGRNRFVIEDTDAEPLLARTG